MLIKAFQNIKNIVVFSHLRPHRLPPAGGSSCGRKRLGASMFMYLYVLYSIEHKHHYIGITKNVESRLSYHNSGSVKSTKAYRPWILLYTEFQKEKKDARVREIFLKKNARARTQLFTDIHNTMAPSSNG